jgi:hypothetical protein
MKTPRKYIAGEPMTLPAAPAQVALIEAQQQHLRGGTSQLVPALRANGRPLASLLAALAVGLFVATTAPLNAQTKPAAPTDQKVVVLKQSAPDGTETVEKQALSRGEGLLVRRLNGKIISKQVIESDGAQRVIIKFKEGSVVQRLSQGMRAADVQAKQEEMLRSREGFRGRLLALENQHRLNKGLPPVTRQAMITREYSYCFNGLAAHVHPETLAEIQTMPEVEGVYVDQQRSKCDGYGISQIGAPQVWQTLGYTGQGVTIAIVDTGIDYLHPDLGGGIGPGYKVVGGYDFVDSDADPMDDNGHGTHVAGIAAANGQIKGVAPDANLLAVKVLNAFGFGFDSEIIAGIEWSVTHGANIINLSLGGPGDPNDPLAQAVDQTTQAGVLVVAAAGNSRDYGTVGSPAVARTALAVGADDQNQQIAFFSSRGPAPLTYQIKPEVVAPGVGIYSTVPFGGCQYSDPSGYLTLDGTSMASPHVAGAAALLLQEHPQWTPQQLELALTERAADLHQDVMIQGSGQVNVYAAATSPLWSTGGQLSLGWDDLRQSTFASSQSLTLTNTTSAATQITLSTQGNVPPGMQVAVSPAVVSLAPGASQTVSFTLNVDNTTTPNLPAQPFAYSGMVVAATGSGDSIHQPFAFCKAPKLVVTSDTLVDTYVIFHGADTPKFQTPFSQGPFEMLLPAGTYDFNFDLMSPGFPTVLRNVLRENVQISSLTTLSISGTEAKNKLAIQAIDQLGSTLSPDASDFHSILIHKQSKFISTDVIFGYGLPLDASRSCYMSDIGQAFTWDGAFAGFFNDPSAPEFIFHSSLHHGLTSSKTFAFKPSEFNKTVLTHSVAPDNQPMALWNWLWEVFPEIGANGDGPETNFSPTAPFDQTVYSIPETDPTVVGGYWSVYAAGAIPSGNLPFWLVDAIYKTPPFRPISRNVLAGYDDWAGEIFRSGGQRILLGQGPAHWSGTMFNQPATIHIQSALNDRLDQKLFHGQCQEELVHGLLPYSLYQRGQLVQAGALTQAMFYIPGLLQTDLANINVTPGAYEMVIPFTGFFMHGKPGQLEVLNQFDTTKSDPNPPYLTSYELLNPLDIFRKNPLLDAIPVTGAVLQFGAADDVKVKDAHLFLQNGKLWLPLPVVKTDAMRYEAYIPWLGFTGDAANLKLIVSDTSGNSLTLTESIPFVKK